MPPPNSYTPSYKLIEQSKYQRISFGVGGRNIVQGLSSGTPGPGTYSISSKFDTIGKLQKREQKFSTLNQRNHRERHRHSLEASPSRDLLPLYGEK